jgi:starch phosphorylase
MNGVLNASILDGWWIEGYNGENGFAIGNADDDLSETEMDATDSLALYETLENEVIPAFYSLDPEYLPRMWIAKMRNSIATLTPQFSSDRMVYDYLTNIYDA